MTPDSLFEFKDGEILESIYPPHRCGMVAFRELAPPEGKPDAAKRPSYRLRWLDGRGSLSDWIVEDKLQRRT